MDIVTTIETVTPYFRQNIQKNVDILPTYLDTYEIIEHDSGYWLE